MNIFRLKNLLIIAITQYFLQYFVLVPALAEAGKSPVFSHWQFIGLVIYTVLAAAGGYVINDVTDHEADKINRPERVTVGGKLSEKKAVGLYVLLNLIGLEIAHSLDKQLGGHSLLLIYSTMVLLLYFYSKKLKGLPLIGNIVVAISCAAVAGIVLFVERGSFLNLSETHSILYQKTNFIFGGYMVFAFLTTLFREIVKDIEDMEGDLKTGLRTLPISFGINVAKKWAFGTGASLIFFIGFLLFWLGKNAMWSGFVYSVVLLLSPIFVLTKNIHEAKSKSEFTQISKWIKWVMLSGLILLFILWLN